MDIQEQKDNMAKYMVKFLRFIDLLQKFIIQR